VKWLFFLQGITEKNEGGVQKKKKSEFSFSEAISSMKKILEFIFIIAKGSFLFIFIVNDIMESIYILFYYIITIGTIR
jgi:hypothetical protein